MALISAPKVCPPKILISVRSNIDQLGDENTTAVIDETKPSFVECCICMHIYRRTAVVEDDSCLQIIAAVFRHLQAV